MVVVYGIQYMVYGGFQPGALVPESDMEPSACSGSERRPNPATLSSRCCLVYLSAGLLALTYVILTVLLLIQQTSNCVNCSGVTPQPAPLAFWVLGVYGERAELECRRKLVERSSYHSMCYDGTCEVLCKFSVQFKPSLFIQV